MQQTPRVRLHIIMYLPTSHLVLCLCAAVAGLGIDELGAVWRALLDRPVAPLGCQGCGARRRATERTFSDSQLTEMRVEFIKKQILDKLRLNEPPKLRGNIPSLPKPLADGGVLSTSNAEASVKKDVDEFYGEKDQVILLPKDVTLNCGSKTKNPSACMLFQLSSELVTENIRRAELWVHKEITKTERLEQVFVVSEVPVSDSAGSEHEKEILDTSETYAEDGWIKIDMTWVVKDWLVYQQLTHKLHIECTGCWNDGDQISMFTEEKQKSFLAIHVNSTNKKHRTKRNVNCSPGVSECCREELYVSFADIGWGDWIIQPEGYHAYFCRGSCTNAPSLTVAGSHYTTVIQKLLHSNRRLNRDADLSPCCTATRLSSLQLLYMDGNQTITQQTLPNMVVESCGCM